MYFIDNAADIITYCNGDIETIANHYIFVVYGNRALAIIALTATYLMLKRKKHNYYKLDQKTSEKLSKISEWENRAKKDQVKHIIKQYIDHYTRVNNIKWEDERI